MTSMLEMKKNNNVTYKRFLHKKNYLVLSTLTKTKDSTIWLLNTQDLNKDKLQYMRSSDNAMSMPKTVFTPHRNTERYISDNNNAVFNIINKAVRDKSPILKTSTIVKPMDFTREVLIQLGIIHQGFINKEAIKRYEKYCKDLDNAKKSNTEDRFNSDKQRKSDKNVETKKQDTYYSYLPRYLRYLKDIEKAFAKKQAAYNTEKQRETERKRLEDIKEQEKNKQTPNLNNKDTKPKNNVKDK